MTSDMTESNETPAQRVESLAVPDLRAAMVAVVASILETRSMRGVPVILNAHALLTQWDVYDVEKEWDDMEFLIKSLRAQAVALA